MDLLKLSFANLRYNQASNIFNIIVLALGIAIIVTLIQVSDQIERRFDSDLAGIDLVVGAKGSPIELILSSVFHIDVPNGNIPLSEAKNLEKNPLIKSYIPLALGDNYNGYRIVGTTPDYPAHYNAKLASGNYGTAKMQAVLGSDVAHASGLQVSQKFTGAHGLSEGGEEHKEFPYTVTGILAPTGTVIDRLILTDISSVWYIHEHHDEEDEAHDAHDAAKKKTKGKSKDSEESKAPEAKPEKEITSLLIAYKTPLAMATLPRLIDKSSSMQAASPVTEMMRLSKLLGFGTEVIKAFGAALVVIAATGFFMALFNTVSDRQYEIALLRILGATRNKIFSFVLAQGLVLGATGTVCGIVFGHIFSCLVRHWIENSRHVVLVPSGFHPYELLCALAAIVISIIASVIPAFMAYRVNVARVITRGQ